MYRLLDMQQITGWNVFRPRVMLALPRTLMLRKPLMRRHADIRQLGGPDDRPTALEVVTQMDSMHVSSAPAEQLLA